MMELDSTPERLSARDTTVIALLLVSAFVVILNETIMSVALPVLMADLRIPASAAQWLTTAFLLTMAIVIPITGFLLQRFHTRSIFIAAMTFFSIGTLICALAPGFEALVGGRIVQACGTAIMLPLLMTTVMTLVPPSSRGKTMGNISIVMSVAPAIGPTLSGLILHVLDWRWLFWLVLPIAIIALVMGAARIQNVTTPRRLAIDVLSVMLSAFAFGGLIFGLSSLGEAARGTVLVPPWIPLVTGAIALVSFITRQLWLQRSDRSLLDLRTFRSSNFTVATLMLAISMLSLFGMIIALPLYVQNVLQMDALATGLLLFPGGLLMGLLAPLVGRIYDARGPRLLVVPGSIIVSAVFWGATRMDENTPFLFVLVLHLGLSVGLALLFTPLFSASLGSLKPQLYSHGSAIIGTVQQLAGAAGTALFITVMTVQSVALTAEGATGVAAAAGGIQSAFMAGAILSLLAVVAAFFVRKPADHIE
ncbi:DHA2 family efflux MFS transporter permease subunit [Homoserinimonas sp. OAct 916]|uniref:DHA2 family efflux MFS transporter permease subunit n=1 Tax=Homoserinimonas sp. OAct 916 TaxID=2211450 RepID=UPI000DBE03FD|nr:DHA2 family efflux MFS transporter permease subunit [Homoserinimonas sp. OAct 916]